MEDLQSRSPESVLTDVPGIGEALAGRALDRIDPDDVRELADAVNSGVLEDVEGFGPQRTEALSDRLTGELGGLSSRRTSGVDPALLSRLRCPVCHRESLEFENGRPGCPECGARFGTFGGVLDFVGDRERTVGLAQTVMESSFYARWYEYFRPTLTRLISPRSLREEYALSTRLLKLTSDSDLLDVGCGNGNFTREFVRHLRALDPDHDGFVLGLDLSRSMLEEAAGIQPTDPAVHYLRADATSMPLRENTFDRLHCAGSLHMMEDVPGTLSNFARVLRPGGVLVVGTFLLGNGTVRPLAKRFGGWISRFHWFTREELDRLLHRAGFRLEETSVAGDAITLRARRRSN